MNAINRIELAIRRTASQMPDTGTKRAFVLLAQELQEVAHEGDTDNEDNLYIYRDIQL